MPLNDEQKQMILDRAAPDAVLAELFGFKAKKTIGNIRRQLLRGRARDYKHEYKRKIAIRAGAERMKSSGVQPQFDLEDTEEL